MQHKKSMFRSLAMVTQLGLSVMTPIFLCIFIGYQADSRWGTKTLVPMLILGVLAGGRCAWRLAMNTLKQDCREEKMLREEQASRTNRPGISKPKRASRIRQGEQDGFLSTGESAWADDKGPAANEEADKNGMAE